MRESWLKAVIRKTISRGAVRVFNNPVGKGFIGEIISFIDGKLTLVKPRRIAFGLMKGSGDLIGWKSLIITPDMVGKKIAVFLSVEVKAPGEKSKPHQLVWQEAVRAAGGIADAVDSVEKAKELIK